MIQTENGKTLRSARKRVREWEQICCTPSLHAPHQFLEHLTLISNNLNCKLAGLRSDSTSKIFLCPVFLLHLMQSTRVLVSIYLQRAKFKFTWSKQVKCSLLFYFSLCLIRSLVFNYELLILLFSYFFIPRVLQSFRSFSIKCRTSKLIFLGK